MAFVSNQSSSEDNTSGTDFSDIHTEDGEHVDASAWMPTEWKELQHMVEFHEECQRVFGEKASIGTIMKNSHAYEPPCA